MLENTKTLSKKYMEWKCIPAEKREWQEGRGHRQEMLQSGFAEIASIWEYGHFDWHKIIDLLREISDIGHDTNEDEDFWEFRTLAERMTAFACNLFLKQNGDRAPNIAFDVVWNAEIHDGVATEVVRHYLDSVSPLILRGYMPQHRSKREKKLRSYEFVSLPVEEAVSMFRQYIWRLSVPKPKYFYDYTDLKFVDAGCGLGNMMLIARLFGFQVFGVEINNQMCHVARWLLDQTSINAGFSKRKKPKVIFGDATLHNYSKYDLAYMWSPMMKSESNVKLAERILGTLPVDASAWDIYGYFRNVSESFAPEDNTPFGFVRKIGEEKFALW